MTNQPTSPLDNYGAPAVVCVPLTGPQVAQLHAFAQRHGANVNEAARWLFVEALRVEVGGR